jgi:hypothetical protein
MRPEVQATGSLINVRLYIWRQEEPALPSPTSEPVITNNSIDTVLDLESHSGGDPELQGRGYEESNKSFKLLRE